ARNVGGLEFQEALSPESASKRSCVLYSVSPSRSLTPMDTTTPACLHASLMAWVAGDGARHGLIEQLQVFTSANDLVGGLDERKVGVVRHHGLRERRKLHALLAKLVDPSHDLFYGALAAYRGRDSVGPRR